MTLLETHLEQISLSAKTIADLQFPPPKIFTNALLGHHEITILIRDTEPQERALSIVDPGAAPSTTVRHATRRGTTFTGEENGTSGRRSIFDRIQSKNQSAVARVLGGDVLHQIQLSSSSATRQKNSSSGSVDIEVLLQGAERLCNIYPVPGAMERIANLRDRHGQISKSIDLYEDKVTKQISRLERMNKGSSYGFDDERERRNSMETITDPKAVGNRAIGEALRLEEQEIRELEMRKRALQERVAGMEKDLGGLLG